MTHDPLPPRRLFGILGSPLGHSVSPALHTWGFARAAYPGAYFAWEKNAEDLPEFFRAVRSLPIDGLSVTIPHKEAVLPYLDALAPRAQAVGAANTLYWRDGRLIGDNTDVAGFLAPLQSRPPFASALVLGAGGVCRAALAGLRELGAGRITVAARRPEKAGDLAARFSCAVIGWQDISALLAEATPDIVINATPLGMRGAHAAQSPLDNAHWQTLAAGGQKAKRLSLTYDLVYTPEQTPFLLQAAAHGLPTQGGLDFFVAQGLMQFSLWTQTELPADEAAALVRRALHL